MTPRDSVTQLLGQMRAGDADALDAIVPLLYDDLRRVAHEHMRGEKRGHTLNTTALVNEAYLRLSRSRRVSAGDRSQFLAAVAVTMRRILVDYARARTAQKRGKGAVPVSLSEVENLLSEEQAEELLLLDEALDRLAEINERASAVVHHRFFAGLSVEETAELLDVSSKTVQRDWVSAKAWLKKEMAVDVREAPPQ